MTPLTRSASVVLSLSASLAVLAGGEVRAQELPRSGQGLSAPAPGVLCDAAGPVCYDSQGLSLGLTREYHGLYAEEKALRQLGGQPAPKVFRLSNGSVCDVGARRCWSDGWDRRSVDERLSRQLFGNQSNPSNQTNQAGQLGGLTRQAQCRLTRWFKVLASGSCEISDQSGGRSRRLMVSMADGNTYTFSNVRGEGYRVSDGKGGSWPVRVSDQGSSLSFAWTDKVLQVTPPRQGGPGKPSLGSLIDSLLGN